MIRSTPLPPGTKAPDFCLKATPDQEVSLDDFQGQPLILAFYPADFSPVCSSEMVLYNELLSEFKKHNAMVLGISVDSVWSHLEFARQNNLHFPLLSDFHPKGEVAQKYNAYQQDNGECERALYLIDGNGNIAWSYISPVGVNPGADGVLSALEELSKREAAGASAG
jgi:peroxiredoxin